MAQKEGGLGFGTIVMCIIFYNGFFGGDDDVDDKKVEIVEDERPAIIETVKESVDELKPEMKAVVDKAKIELGKFKAEVEIAIKQKDNPKPESKPEKKKKIVKDKVGPDDSFDQEDIYGNTEDKW